MHRGGGEFLQFFHAMREEKIAKKSNFHRFGKSHFRAKMGFEKVFVILCHLVTTSFFCVIFGNPDEKKCSTHPFESCNRTPAFTCEPPNLDPKSRPRPTLRAFQATEHPPDRQNAPTFDLVLGPKLKELCAQGDLKSGGTRLSTDGVHPCFAVLIIGFW